MDLGVTDDWEFLSRDAVFLDDHPPVPPPPASFPVVVGTGTADIMPLVLDMNYFICPSSPPSDPGRGGPRLLLPFPIDDQFEASKKKKAPPDPDPDPNPNPDHPQGSPSSKQIIPKLPSIQLAADENNNSSSRISIIREKEFPNIPEADDQDPVSHVSFKKMKETEFVDIKVELESPKSSSSSSSTSSIVLPLPLPQAQIVVVPPPSPLISDVDGGGGDHRDMMRFENKPPVDHPSSSEQENIVTTNSATCCKVANGASVGGRGFNNLWRWGVGVAATAVCILIFGPHHHHHKNKHQSQLRIQFYTHHKGGGMKQVVQQAATLNEAISAAVAGVPFARSSAHITFGGYYDAL